MKSKSIEQYNESFHEGMLGFYVKMNRWTRLRLKQLVKMANPSSDDNIIDLGCSSGAITHFCSTFGARVTGVDASDAAIRMTKKTFKNNNLISFYKADVSDLSIFGGQSFNKAVAFDLVEHLPQETFEKMLKEVYRILKPKGVLCIYTPNPTHIIEHLKAREFLKQNPTHIAIRTMDDICMSMEQAGFTIELVYFTPSFIPIINVFETIFGKIPKIGELFRYRICIRGIKPDSPTMITWAP